MNFDAKKTKNDCVQWIKDWFDENGKDCIAVIGISGGKDSTIAAALCVEALGSDRVLGVRMPNFQQSDLKESIDICEYLGIKSYTVDIGFSVSELKDAIHDATDLKELSSQTKINLPPRIRMATLYAISQSVNGRVVNTCNKSEDWVGYSTKYGDAAGDFSPLSNLLVSEVKAIGYELGLPEWMIEKTPADGLCGRTDEDNLGFTYKQLDAYIGDGIEPPAAIKAKIDQLHEKNLFKLLPMAAFEPKKSAD